ncbi:LCP family protein [Clostridium hydrogeniformans]|uniref:LCP family protein n=1 Tax=Clostridium hydrogeniformans TaxID=349933 RepID=UPI000486BEE5|nr:LCP family protein [Clostridium hydrogeniformans]
MGHKVKNNKKKKQKNKMAMVILTLLICILVAGLTSATFFYNFIGKFSKNDIKALVPNSKDEPINVLLLGLDIGEAGQDNKKVPKRSDTMMIVNYNKKNDSCTLVSIPRDTYVEINGKSQKINAAHAIGGPSLAIKSVENLLDTKINYYVTIDYEGFRSFIDAIGGIEMEIDRDMIYDDNTQNLHIRFKKGEKVTLDGKKAEEFFRWRKNNDGTGFADGDIGRIENQHKLMSKVMEKVTSPAIVTKVGKILDVIPKYVETNLNGDDILNYGMNFVKMNRENFTQYTLKGDSEYIKGLSYFLYDKKKNKEVLSILNGENNELSKDKDTKKNLNIEILNGTNINGLASSYSKLLKDNGYDHITTGNTKPINKSKVIVKGTENKELELLIKKDFNIENIEFLDGDNGNFDIIVILGKDYKKN